MVKQYELYLVALDPTVGSELKKTRPCVVISPNEMNKFLNTVLIAPLTSAIKPYPTRILVTIAKRDGQIALDQIRTVDKVRLVKKIGTLQKHSQQTIKRLIKQMLVDD